MDVEAFLMELEEVLGSLEAAIARLRLLIYQSTGGEVIQVPGQGPWTKGMLARLWAHVDRFPGVVALFEECAAHPNEGVYYRDVLARSGLDPQWQRNQHASLSRAAVELFGERRWPIQAWQGPPRGAGEPAEMMYRMGATVADWWRDVAHG